MFPKRMFPVRLFPRRLFFKPVEVVQGDQTHTIWVICETAVPSFVICSQGE